MLSVFRKKDTSPAAQMREILGDYELPSFPSVMLKALDRVRDPESSDARIADLLVNDPGFSAKLLLTVNSAAFGLQREVRNVHHAISLLGRNQLESMLIALGVRSALPSKRVRGFNNGRFWGAAARRAVVARELADRIDPSHRSESFTAALLQDMALPILSHRKEADYGLLLEHWHHSTEDLAALERSSFGWDHCYVGALMCEGWRIPETLSEAISSHHESAKPSEVLPAVHLVAVLREADVEQGVEQIIECAHDRFNEPKDDVERLVRRSFESAGEMTQLFA